MSLLSMNAKCKIGEQQGVFSIIPYKTKEMEEHDEERQKNSILFFARDSPRHSAQYDPSAKISFVRRIQKFKKSIDKILKIV